MVLHAYELGRLLDYLGVHHYDTWAELTEVPGFGPDHWNPYRFEPFLDSPDDLGDPRVNQLKSDYKQVRWFTAVIVLTSLLLFVCVGT